MIRLLAFGLFMMSAINAAAAPARVRSGEHIGFTRLVVYLPTGVDWQLDRTEQGYVFLAPQWQDGFDISRVFEMIPQSRLNKLEPTESQLELGLNCDCEITAEPFRNGAIILDIRAATEGVARQNVAPKTARTEFAKFQKPTPTTPPPTLPMASASPTALPMPSTPPPALPFPVTESATLDPQIELFRRNLLEKVGRAATQAILTPKTQKISSPTTPQVVDDQEAAPDLQPLPPIENDRLRVTSAIERALAEGRGTSSSHPTVPCYPNSHMDIASWGDDAPFGAQISQRRAKLIEEFDTANPQEALALARQYAFFGLGAEARKTLDQFELRSLEADAVRSIAYIVDGLDQAMKQPISEMISCGGSVSMWAALSRPSEGATPAAQSKNIAAVFSDLPHHLRELLGPPLIARFLAADQDTEAGIIRNAILRGGARETPQLELVQAVHDTVNDSSLDQLETLVERNDETSAKALATYLERLNENSREAKPEYIELAAALSAQLDGLPISKRLKYAEILAGLNSGRFMHSSELFFQVSNPDEVLINEFVKKSVQVTTTAEFVDFAIKALEAGTVERLAHEQIEALAVRLLDEGLPDLAVSVIRQADDQATFATILFDAFLASDRTEEAVALLSKLPADQAEILKVGLVLERGFSRDDLDLQDGALDQDVRDDLAWANNDFERISTDDPRRKVAETLLADASSVDLENRPIGQSESLLKASAASRAALKDLLQVAE